MEKIYIHNIKKKKKENNRLFPCCISCGGLGDPPLVHGYKISMSRKQNKGLH